MTLLSQSPFEWLEFDKDGALVDPSASARLLAALSSEGVRDLVVISHGWKTDQAGANELYKPLWENVTKALVAAGGPAPGNVVVAGVLWPSKPFQTDFDAAAAKTTSGGTLSAADPVAGDGDLPAEALTALLEDYRVLVGPTHGAAVAAAAAANTAGFTDTTAGALMRALKASVGLTGGPLDTELHADADGFSDTPLNTLLNLAPPPVLPLGAAVGGTLSLGDTLSNIIQGPRAAVGRLLNQFTYFAMKQRAGVVGDQLGGAVLSALRPPQPVRLHLIGHSFGARLVTAAAAAFEPSTNLTVASLTLLQGAYSHNGMSASFANGQVGAYAKVVANGLVRGPITMTHTHNDSACTVAYPLASRLSRDITKSLGDASDLFGAMGANGAQNLPAAAYAPDQAMAKGKPAYPVTAGKVNRMLADACVSEHMDVTNADVGALVASVLRT
jgi:hypothetical protein